MRRRERERARVCVYVCVCVRERVCVCVFVYARDRVYEGMPKEFEEVQGAVARKTVLKKYGVWKIESENPVSLAFFAGVAAKRAVAS